MKKKQDIISERGGHVSAEFKAGLDSIADDFLKNCSHEELAYRIAMALSEQDSCGKCESKTIKYTLQEGLWMCCVCDECEKEIVESGFLG